jgi:hypothetical protein
VFEDTNSLGVTIAHDSVTIQHIDTPDQTAYFTNEYIGFEDMGGTPHSAWIEHDVITVQDVSGMTQVRATGITFPDSSTQATAAATNNSQLATSVVDYYGSYVITAGNANTIITPSQYTNFYLDDDDHNPFPTGAQILGTDLGHPPVLKDREDVPINNRLAHGLGAVGHAVLSQPAPGVLAKASGFGQAALFALLFLSR